MKSLALYATITILLLAGITTIVYSVDLSWEEEPINRDTALHMLTINDYPEYYFATDKYKKEKNKFDYYMSDKQGTDGDGPLYTTANIIALIYTNGGQWENFSSFAGDSDHIDSDRCQYIQPSLRFPLGMYQVYEPNRKTGATAYAYAKCTTDYKKYKSKYEVYAEIPQTYNPMNIMRKKPPMTLYGPWSDSAYVSGSIDAFENPTLVNSTAKAQAIGNHPSTGENNETEASTEGANFTIDIICNNCLYSSDRECWSCQDIK